MKVKFRLKPVVVALVAIGSVQVAVADIYQNNSIFIQANNNEPNGTGGFNGEGVFISSNYDPVTGSGGAAFAQFVTGGGAQIWGTHQALLQSDGSYFSALGNAASIAGNSVLIQSNANTILGPTSINVDRNAATSINTGTSLADVTIGNADNKTTIQSGTNVITGAANSMLSSGGNTIAAVTTNTISVTGNGGSNNLTADGADSSNNISATGNGGANNISGTTNVNVGTGGNVNNFATNINTGTNTQAVSIGNSGLAGTNVVTARSGHTTMSLANSVASLTAGPTLATNGVSGTTSAVGSGGLTVYNTAQTIGASVGNVLTGKSFQNQINGNLFVDGNVYINGTLDYVSRNAANTTVVGDGLATSKLANATGATAGGMAVVMKGTTVPTTQSVVDANGRITNVAVSAGAPAAESTASLTLTNGLGNTHGLVVTESQTTMSGGTSSSSLTLNDSGATFSNARTGQPVRVHGVYDGRDDFDAVNVRQLGAGVAMSSALAAMPQVDTSKRFNLTAGLGNYLNASALAIGGSLRVRPSTLVRFGAAFSTSRQRMVNVGLGHSF